MYEKYLALQLPGSSAINPERHYRVATRLIQVLLQVYKNKKICFDMTQNRRGIEFE